MTTTFSTFVNFLEVAFKDKLPQMRKGAVQFTIKAVNVTFIDELNELKT